MPSTECLPRDAANDTVAAVVAPSVSSQILVVEDDAPTREMLAHALTGEGFDVVAVGSGQEAVDLLENGLRPTVMVVDLILPLAVSGRDVLDLCRTDMDLRNIRTIAITGRPTIGLRLFADTVMFKPLDIDRFITTVRALAARQSN